MGNSTAAAAGPPPSRFKVYTPGERPNENRGPEMIAATASLTALALIVVTLRVYVKLRFNTGLAIDDYLMVLAVIVLWGMAGVIIAEVKAGAGRHMEYIDPQDFVRAMHLNFSTQPTVFAALGLARLSVCFFLLRFAPTRWVKWTIHISAAASTFITIFGIVQTSTQCTPMAFTWDKTIPGGRCVDQNYLVISSFVLSGISCTIDFVLASLPIPMLWNVQLKPKVKIAVIAILSLGFFTVIAAIIKTVALAKWGLLGDYMWDSVDITIWYTTEVAVAIVAGSIPCLKPLFKSIMSTTRRYGSHSKPPGNSASASRRKSSRRPAADPYSIANVGAVGSDRFEMYSPTGSGHKVPSSVVDPSLLPTPPRLPDDGDHDDDAVVRQADGRRRAPLSPGGITATTHITVFVEDADREKSV